MNKNYYAIIPAFVRYDKRLPMLSRFLYGELTALCNEKGYCWASNRYFAELYEVSIETISRYIAKLKEFGIGEAIFIHNLAFRIKKNQSNNKHYYKGY